MTPMFVARFSPGANPSCESLTRFPAAAAIPFAIFTVALYALYAAFTRHADPFHLALLAGATGVLVLSVALAALGVGVAACLLVLMFAPVVTVVGYETVGDRHLAEALEKLR